MPRAFPFSCTFVSFAEARTSTSALSVPMLQASKQHRALIGKAPIFVSIHVKRFIVVRFIASSSVQTKNRTKTMAPSETKGYEPKHEQETGALCSAMELCQVRLFMFGLAFVCLCFFHVPCIHSRMHREWYDFIASRKNKTFLKVPKWECPRRSKDHRRERSFWMQPSI